MPTKIEKDAVTGQETTGHEWDGIKELNNPLPRWWLYVLYATIAWSLVYYVLYPSWPLINSYTQGVLGLSHRQLVEERMAEARAAQADMVSGIANASLSEIEASDDLRTFAMRGGAAAFAENCQPCHGAGGSGALGRYPNLADDDWLWGGQLSEIQQTIQHGIRWPGDDETRFSQMPAFGQIGILDREQVDQVAEYVMSLSGRADDPAKAEQGAAIFAEQCASCHGPDGKGNQEFGAPDLTDAIWLYGGDKRDIVETVTYARNQQMPAWAGRLDSTTIKMLAVYVYSLGGGERPASD
jgi:cytochrome c oxidase cbb3-type subunit 3